MNNLVTTRTAAESVLTPVRMELPGGYSAEVIPAGWTADVAEAFHQEQYLAFAVAAAEALGEDGGVLLIYREGDYELVHAFAHIEIDDQEWLIDSHGWIILHEELRNRGQGGQVVPQKYVTASEARAWSKSWALLPEQEWDLAAGFVGHVLENRFVRQNRAQKETPVSMPTTFADDPESQRITGVVQAAADESYRRRTRTAETVLVDKIGTAGLARERVGAGLTEERWLQLCGSSQSATPAEFQSFSRALHVSARWLAVGSGTPQTPPPGWDYFGTNIDTPGPLEFSHECDSDGLPLWERPAIEEAA